jgi:DNA-directed RNA polymerase subunit RPC12/RpoP|tara:strand:- start:142 stop:429 length:288 start_codon:yes stop_codon:yes gene_type:complete
MKTNPCPICKSSNAVRHFEKSEKEAEIKCTTCNVSVTYKSEASMTINGITTWLIDYEGLLRTWNKLNPVASSPEVALKPKRRRLRPKHRTQNRKE